MRESTLKAGQVVVIWELGSPSPTAKTGQASSTNVTKDSFGEFFRRGLSN